MKKTLLTLSLLMMTLALSAIPAKKGLWKTLRLTDGTEVRAQLCGDEHLHYWTTEDGTRLARQQDGTFAAADMEQLGRKATARRAKLQTGKRLAHTININKQTRRVAIGEKTHYTGKKKGIVILAQFTDVKFKSANNLEKYKKILNGENYNVSPFKGSVADYFKAQSAGQFELEFDVVGPYTMSNKRSYYGRNDNDDNDVNPEAMIVEAVKAADAEVNFKDYDWDGDGYVDQVFVLYAGTGEADSYDEEAIWPHMYELSATNRSLKLDGVTIDTYACSNEIDMDGGIEGIGCFCHEFSHCMGFPDFYDTSYSGQFGMSAFDLMDSGAYNGDTFRPAGYTAHEKMMCGWQEPIVLNDEDVHVANMQPMSSHGQTYIIYNEAHPDEYYMLENRQQTGFDTSYPAKGLMITHVDFDEDIWEMNIPNTIITTAEAREMGYSKANDHQRMTIVHADNDDDSKYWKYDYSYGDYAYTKTTLTTDLYPYQQRDSLTATSTPATTLFNKNTDGSKFLTGAILNIKQNADGTISFDYRAKGGSLPGESGTGTNPVKPTGDYLFYESFDKCAGKGGNDNIWSGSIANSDFYADNEGWEAEKGFGANKCAKFGTSKVAGMASTPTFYIDGEAKLTFRAATWGSDPVKMELSASNGATITTSSFNMGAGEWADLSTTVKGEGQTAITFSAAKRFFLDEVLVVSTITSGITTHHTTATRPAAIYTLDGRYVGTDADMLPRGIYVRSGRKFVK